jgi:uncharacterized membrane protein YczE
MIMRKFAGLRSWMKPHTTVPTLPWTATNTWDLSIKRFSILSIGLILFGIGESFLIVSNIGNYPWTVLSEGVSNQFDISIGVATFIVSIGVLLLWVPLREKPGFGTLLNILLIAVAIDLGLLLIPEVDIFFVEFLYVLIGIALVGVGSALYITCGLGPGPRDGWMTSLHRRTGIPVGRVRLLIEVLVLISGWLLGGTVGLGTALFALLIGQSVAISFGVVARITKQ